MTKPIVAAFFGGPLDGLVQESCGDTHLLMVLPGNPGRYGHYLRTDREGVAVSADGVQKPLAAYDFLETVSDAELEVIA